ncbi:hypothetical protein NST72_01450 [Bacillus sp. FSL W7-1282]
MENQSTGFILSEINIAVHIRKVFGQKTERFIYFMKGKTRDLSISSVSILS